jgi:hypothetical protein
VLIALAVPCRNASAQQVCDYSGRAYGAYVNVAGMGPTYFADTGDLPPTGGTLTASLVNVNAPGIITATTMADTTTGANCKANSAAAVENVTVLQGNPAQVHATLVKSNAYADCASLKGMSTIVGLTFGGIPVTVTGAPNQTVTIPGVATLTIDEQISGPGKAFTVNALHLRLLGGTQDVIIASAHSDVFCMTPTKATTWGSLKSLYR